MKDILTLFYLLLFLGVSFTGAYIAYHILRYSISKRQAVLTAGLFGSVLVLLMVTNAVLFFRIDWDAISSASLLPDPSRAARSTSGY